MPNHIVNQRSENGNNSDVIFPPIKLAKVSFLWLFSVNGYIHEEQT